MAETRITFTLNRLVSVLNSHADAILRSRYNMTYSQFVFLLSLKPGQMSMTELSECLDVSTAAVSKRAPWFEERGLIRIAHDPNHGRRVLLGLTRRGNRLVDKAAEELDRAFVEQFVDIDDGELTRLNSDLNRILTRLSQSPKEAP